MAERRRAPVTARRIGELERGERRRAVARTVLIIAVAWVLLIGVYYVVPSGPGSVGFDILRLVIGLVLLFAVIGWQASHVVRSEVPQLRAAQALGVVLPLFLVLFSSIYLSLADNSRAAFSEILDHTKALYFTITVFSTVGFGDITPTTDGARILVSAQMLLDLVIIGAVARFLLTAAKIGLSRNQEAPPDQ
jgi:voltage-gated potassium channel